MKIVATQATTTPIGAIIGALLHEEGSKNAGKSYEVR